MRWRGATALLSASALVLAGCGGGGDGGQNGSGNAVVPTPSPTPPPSGQLFTPPAQEALSITDVQAVIAQAVAEAQSRNLPSVIAVTDRVGNVLAVFDMNGAPDMAALSRRQIGGMAASGSEIGLQGAMVPSTAAAIAKALTGAYLSSSGNAFTSRTASMIVQEHFPPAPTTVGLESGPLFGVQFSQLPCSDLSARADDGLIGPKRSPLGLAADPGGLPLYKNGVVVGGIGVMGDGDYGFDPNILDVENDAEEAIAIAGAQGFMPPTNIRANRIFVDGTSLRFTDVSESQITGGGGSFAAINGTAGNLVPVTGYTDGTLRSGTAYGSEASGIRASTAAEFSNRDAWVLTDGAGIPRYPIRSGTDGGSVAQPLTADEVRTILEEAFTILSRARAQIRRPTDSRMQASISLVDTHGEVLGIVRSPDGPIFGVDVSLQKARTAAFFSNPVAAADLAPIPAPPGGLAGADYVNRVRTFLGDPAALTGNFAFADRSGGNLSRPYFPDGEVSAVAGPLSVQVPATFSPFAVGLQTDLVVPNIGAHLAFVSGTAASDTPRGCTLAPNSPSGSPRIANGVQIFPGSVPIYRGNVLVGGIGVSGDGIDQDDMVSFLGLHNAGVRTGSVNNADPAIRADRIVVNVNGRNTRLRYINCPFAPFLDTDAQNVCQGL
ncbi:heme-binding protein [Aurantiacibacter sp. MUD61]|uniref:heme-binding protein n=1 Tax=Aurantiacibacter sp. MUD61 TaxID=3009083 RepID=UPI0022F06501|nr:heme-binding protein [Aurantiacibacter sp. MUD61]